MDFMSFHDLAPAFPEIFVAISVLCLLMVGVFVKKNITEFMCIAAIVVLFVAAWMAAFISPDGVLFAGGFVNDSFARFMKIVVLIGAAMTLVISVSSVKLLALNKFEYPILILLATLGMMMMVSANDLMSLYVGLELQSLALYVLAAFRREDRRATEAGVKYFVLGALSSGLLLYGASLIYGFTGHTQFELIAQTVNVAERNVGVIFGLVFLMAGISFKISAVPFHMWTPDVYEGAPTPVTAFFAAAPKVAAMALLGRVTYDAFGKIPADWQQVLIFLSIASMVLASFAAIGQKNIKRMLAYSSIGHVGFALVGLSSANIIGLEGVSIYMVIYMVMTIGVFAGLIALRNGDVFAEKIDDLAGLSQTKPYVAAMIAIFMFSLVGLPPLAGFFAKWQVFLAAMEAKFYVLAVIGMLASAVSAFYYLRIVKVMYFDEPKIQYGPIAIELKFVIGLAGVLLLTYYFVLGVPLSEWARGAAESLL